MDEIIEVGSECRERFLCQRDYPEFQSIGVFVAGLSDLHEIHHIKREFTQWAIFSATLDGHGLLQVAGKEYALQAQSLCYIPPHTAFEISLEPQGFRQSAWIMVDTHTTGVPGMQPWHRRCDLGSQLYHCLESLDYERNTHQSDLIRRGLIQQLSLNITRLFRKNTTMVDSRLEGLMAAVRKDPGRAWNLHDMCQHVSLSSSHLHRLCQKGLGLSPKQLLLSLRMNYAQFLLQQSQRSVTDIAFSAGFSSPDYFSTVFRQQFGQSPRAYRNQFQVKMEG